MNYLLDVSVLLAVSYTQHVHYLRAKWWLDDVREHEISVNFATCSITELGFVRVACGSKLAYAENLPAAQKNLIRLKRDYRAIFFDDMLGADSLPSWVERSKQVTDGHLLALAKTNHARLVTLDTGIPGALLIPEYPADSSMVRERRASYGFVSSERSVVGLQ